jgi:hypothetical protein
MARLYTFERLVCSGCSEDPRPNPPDRLEPRSHVLAVAQAVRSPWGASQFAFGGCDEPMRVPKLLACCQSCLITSLYPANHSGFPYGTITLEIIVGNNTHTQIINAFGFNPTPVSASKRWPKE